MKSLFGLVLLILAIFGIIDCLKSNMEPTKKALWIVLIILLPLIGLILYYLLAKKSSSY